MPLLSSFEHTDPASELKFVARAIRRDKGQTRADVSIQMPLNNGFSELDRDEFRFSDRTKRNALANSAFTALKREIPLPGQKEEMQLLLRMFLDMVEGRWQSALAVEVVEGLEEPILPPWVIPGYATEGAGTLLVGPPGAAKSWTGLLMAQCVAHAVPTIYGPLEPRPVLYVNLERSKVSLQNRLGLVNRVLGLPPTTAMPQINARGRRWTDIQEVVRRRLETDKPQFVVLDSLSRMGMGSMSDDETANAMMDEMNALGVTWIAIGHTPRPSGPGEAARKQSEHVFGSQMITAAADFEIILKSNDEDTPKLVGMKVIKANDAGKIPFAGWQYHFNQFGLSRVIKVPNPSYEAFE